MSLKSKKSKLSSVCSEDSWAKELLNGSEDKENDPRIKPETAPSQVNEYGIPNTITPLNSNSLNFTEKAGKIDELCTMPGEIPALSRPNEMQCIYDIDKSYDQ